MTVHDDTPRLTSAERDFVERLAEHYSPPPMTAAERVAFDEALHSHVVRRRTWTLNPLAVAATAAALGMWLVVQNGTAPDLTGQDETRLQTLRETAGQHETVGEVLLVLGFDEPNGQDGDEGLPKEYAAISTMLNDG
jgi:hypothetical protein